MLDYIKELVILIISGVGGAAFFTLLVIMAPLIALFTVDKK